MMTFGKFVASREDAGYSDGDPTVEINDTGAYKLDNIQEDAGVIQQELVEMQNAEETIEEMKDELAQAAVNYAEATGGEKPSNVEIDGEEVTEVSSDVEPEIDASAGDVEDQVAEKTVELEATVENLMGRLMKTSAYKAKERLGIYSKRTRIDLQSIRANPLQNYAQSMEELGETIKNAGKRVWDWLKELWRKIIGNLQRFLPFLRNFQQKGTEIVKRCDAIKRPELKNDEKGDWSDKFIISRIFFKKLGGKWESIMDKSIPLNTISKMEQIVSKGEAANDAAATLAVTILSEAKSLSNGGETSSEDLYALYSADTNIKYEINELAVFGLLSNELTITGFNYDNFKEYSDYLDDSDKDAKTIKLEMGIYKLEFNENSGRKKRHEEKISARDLVDYAKDCGVTLRNVGRFEKNAKDAQNKMKKLLDKLDTFEKNINKAHQGQTNAQTRSMDDLSKMLKAVAGACNSLTSFPKLLVSVANEALSAVKDGDKE